MHPLLNPKGVFLNSGKMLRLGPKLETATVFFQQDRFVLNLDQAYPPASRWGWIYYLTIAVASFPPDRTGIIESQLRNRPAGNG